MNQSAVPWVRRTALLLTLAVGIACVAPVALATEQPPAAPVPSATEPQPLASAAAAKLAGLDTTEAALATTQTAVTEPAPVGGKSFFKTTKGAFALALMAGGLGYMAYSFSNDRVSSPQR